MGGNGSKAAGTTENLILREYKGVYMLGNDIKIVESIDQRKRVKLPEESHTPDRIYVVANKDGTFKSIGVYGLDCKKQLEIHSHDGHGPEPHYHIWADGKPEAKGSGKNAKTIPRPLTPELKLLYNYVKMFFP